MIAEALGQFRLVLADRPLVLTALLLVAVWVPLRSDTLLELVYRHGRRLLLGIAAVAICWLSLLCFWYLALDAYFDTGEPIIPAVAWIFRHGEPLYHSLDAAVRYSHIYGPAAFLVQAASLATFGPSIAASKLPGVVGLLGGLALLFWACRRISSSTVAFILTGVAALICLQFRNFMFWTRPEPLMIFFVSCGLAGALLSNGGLAILAVTVSAALLVSLKVSGVFVALPLFAVLLQTHGVASTLISAVASGVLSMAPFLIPGISLQNYLDWLRVSGHNGLMIWSLRLNTEWATFLLLPAALWVYRTDRRERSDAAVIGAALAIGATGIGLLGSKPGAGFYHLAPLAPAMLFFAAQALASPFARVAVSRDLIAVTIAFLCALTSIAVAQQQGFLHTMAGRRDERVVEDLQRFTAANPGLKIGIGSGGAEYLSMYRPWLVFQGHPYLLDPPAVVEGQLSGLTIPDGTVDLVRSCALDVWLIARGAEPFEMANGYFPAQPTSVFDDRFKSAFRSAYTRAGATEYFDVWRCRQHGGGPPR